MDIMTYLDTKQITQSAFASSLGISPGLVYQWVKGLRPIAPGQCVAIERLTEGAVTRRDLRTDWREIWPELSEEKV